MDIRHIDTCLPCYFNGCDLPYIQVSVDGSTTRQSLEADMLSEWNSGYVANEDQLLDGQNQDDVTKQVEAAIKKYCSGLPANPFPNLDIPTDDDRTDFVYAYFVIETE